MPPVTRPRASAMTLNERPSRKRTAIAKALPQRISPVESAPSSGGRSMRGKNANVGDQPACRAADEHRETPDPRQLHRNIAEEQLRSPLAHLQTRVRTPNSLLNQGINMEFCRSEASLRRLWPAMAALRQGLGAKFPM